jgi:hypothetical protein
MTLTGKGGDQDISDGSLIARGFGTNNHINTFGLFAIGNASILQSHRP